MVYPIYVYGMPVLRKVARDIDRDYEGLEQLIQDMFETMYQAEGLGLAAPQIGLSIRLIVIDGSRAGDDEDESEIRNFKRILINPHIIEENGEEWEFNEGCLSIPGVREDVKRKPEILLRYMDENFTPHEERFDGVKARVLQHEMDHVNGILFTDRISPLRKRLLNTKLKAISKGQTEAIYAIRYPKKPAKTMR
jgi:peptide deformylase